MDTNKKESWADRYVLYTGSCASRLLVIMFIGYALFLLILYIRSGTEVNLHLSILFVFVAHNVFGDRQFYSIIKRQKGIIKGLESKLQKEGDNPNNSREE